MITESNLAYLIDVWIWICVVGAHRIFPGKCASTKRTQQLVQSRTRLSSQESSFSFFLLNRVFIFSFLLPPADDNLSAVSEVANRRCQGIHAPLYTVVKEEKAKKICPCRVVSAHDSAQVTSPNNPPTELRTIKAKYLRTRQASQMPSGVYDRFFAGDPCRAGLQIEQLHVAACVSDDRKDPGVRSEKRCAWFVL